jgi:hypothetical protein
MSSLAGEARHLHACLFDRPADELTIQRYEAAHRQWFADEKISALMRTVVERRLDAEAVEFALRGRGKGRELRRKLQIISYLAEPRAEYLDEFVNLEASRVRAWTALAGAALRSLWKLGKGEYTVRRHGLL